MSACEALAETWGPLLQAMGEAAWIADARSGQVRLVNLAAAAMLGRDAAQLIGCDAASLIATPEDQAYWDQVRAGQFEALHSEALLATPDGRCLPVERRIQPLAGPDGSMQLLVTVVDRSESARRQEAGEVALAQLQATLESTADGILVTDLAGRIRAFNRRFAQLWNLPADLQLAHDDAAVFDWMRRSVADPQAYQRRVEAINEATLLRAIERIELHAGRVLECVTQTQVSRGRPCGRVWAYRDLTELISAGHRIEALSTTDALTGLYNRHQIGERLADALQRAQRDGSPLALLVIDLDRFKQINDGLGPGVGDRVLLEAARRIQSCLQQGDVAARIGGDQFALLVHGADHRGAEAAARRALAAVSQPCRLDGLQFTLTCSVGVALYPTDGDLADVLMRHAETAMQRAKIGGRAGYRFHQQRHDDDLRQRMRLDHAMRQALASRRFRLKYQPQVDLQSGAVVGAEALIRWRDPELGEVPPAQFIPVAEDTGFIIAIGDWVLKQAVRQAAQWVQEGLKLPVSINVSALQFQQPGFVERVATVLREHGLPGHLLELELTESILLIDADEALQRLSKLARLGVGMAIDDFGTGYSSLAYLKRFPIERLKIDRSFVQGLPGDESDAGIVRAIIQMSRALGLQVIAEGVETEAQRAFLMRAGCDQFQGFLCAPALDALSFQELARQPVVPRRGRLKLVPSA